MFSFTGITKNCQLLYDSGLSSPGAVFSLVDLGPGAAVGGMRIEINTGYSCYLTADRFPNIFVFSILTMISRTFSQGCTFPGTNCEGATHASVVQGVGPFVLSSSDPRTLFHIWGGNVLYVF